MIPLMFQGGQLSLAAIRALLYLDSDIQVEHLSTWKDPEGELRVEFKWSFRGQKTGRTFHLMQRWFDQSESPFVDFVGMLWTAIDDHKAELVGTI